MKIKTKVILATTLTLICSSVLLITYFKNNGNEIKNTEVLAQSQNSTGSNVSFSEIRLSEDEIIENASLIVKGKITGHIKSDFLDIKEDKEKGTAGIEWPYSIYELEISEVIDGKANKKEEIVFAGSELPVYINIGEEYVFFLEEETEKLTKVKYHLLSYSQGIYTMNDNSLEGKVDTSIKIKKDKLDEKIKEKNEKKSKQ